MNESEGAPPTNPWLHRVANACQVLAGLMGPQHQDAAFDQLDRIATILRRPESGPLSGFVCRAMLRESLMRLPALGFEVLVADWASRVITATAGEGTLYLPVRQLIDELKSARRHPLAFEQRLLRCVDALHHHPHLTEQEVADALQVSRTTVGRVLRRQVGKSFRTLVREARLKHAMSLLASDLSLKQIASTVGYQHPSQLSRDFARHRLATPSHAAHG